MLIFDSPVKDDLIAEVPFELGPFHAWAEMLDGIEDIDAGFDQVGDEIAGRSVAVEEDFFAMGMAQVAPPF